MSAMTWLVLISLIAVFSGWFLRRELIWFWSYAGLCFAGLIWLAVLTIGQPLGQFLVLAVSLSACLGAFVQSFRIIGAEMRGGAEG